MATFKSALVTGSSGFVGRHMSRLLLHEGYDVTQVDIINGMDVRKFFPLDATPYDVVVHAAAHVGGRHDIERIPAFIAAYNLQLDGALFEWALRAQPKHLVYLSSSAAYPVRLQEWQEGLPQIRLREEHIDLKNPCLPDQTYGWVKLMGEVMAKEYAKAARSFYGRVHVVRPFSGYGSDQDSKYPFGAFTERALRKEDPFKVWGNGQQVRDFIHIDDICRTILRMVEVEVLGPVNLCTGVGYTMLELAREFCDVAGYNPNIETMMNEPTGVQVRIGDPWLMHQTTSSTIPVREGIERALSERCE